MLKETDSNVIGLVLNESSINFNPIKYCWQAPAGFLMRNFLRLIRKNYSELARYCFYAKSASAHSQFPFPGREDVQGCAPGVRRQQGGD